MAVLLPLLLLLLLLVTASAAASAGAGAAPAALPAFSFPPAARPCVCARYRPGPAPQQRGYRGVHCGQARPALLHGDQPAVGYAVCL